MKRSRIRWLPALLVGLLVIAVVSRLVTRQRWESRVGEFCYGVSALKPAPQLVFSNTHWSFDGTAFPEARAYPEPDAIIIRDQSVAFVWEPSLIAWVPPSWRTSWDRYGLEFTFLPSGEVRARCRHGSD